MKISNNQEGQISIDFLTAISIFLIAFFFIVFSLSGITSTYHNNKKSVYPAAERVSNLLVKDPGLKEVNDPSWEQWWPNNKSKIARIGFSTHLEDKNPLNFTTKDTPSHYILSFHKIDGKYNLTLGTEGLMKRHGENISKFWWSFGEEIDKNEYKNFTASLDLYPKYDVYIQIRPLNTNLSLSELNNETKRYVPEQKDPIKVEKIVYIKRYDQQDNTWLYLINKEGKLIKYSFMLWMW